MEIFRSGSAISQGVSYIQIARSTASTYDGEAHGRGGELAAPLLDVLRPLLVVLEAVGRNTDDLHVALREVRRPADPRSTTSGSMCAHGDVPASHLCELSGADGREVTRVREEDGLRKGASDDERSAQAETKTRAPKNRQSTHGT